MTISITRYVNIVSSVGAGTSVPRRNLKGRIFDQNELIPTDSFLTFTSAADVGAWFGTSSEEYSRAVYYFGWVSKNGIIPSSIDFARWNEVDTAPEIFGNTQAYVTADAEYVPQDPALYTGISAGSLGLTIAGITHNISGMDFTAVVTLADVANVLETAIQAADVSPFWASATVTYDAVRGSFQLVGGATGVATVSATDGVGGTPVGKRS